MDVFILYQTKKEANMVLAHNAEKMLSSCKKIDENAAQNGTTGSEVATLSVEIEREGDGTLKLDGRTIAKSQDLIPIYQGRLRSYGFNARTLLYPDPELHTTKIVQYGTILKEVIKPEDSVFDIGCGYGSLVLALPPCTYIGIDLVPEFIEYANEQFVDTSVAAKVTFQCGDLEHWEGDYDWCILMGVLNSVPDPDLMLENAWRRCRKGMIVDLNDCKKALETKYRVFDMGQYTEYFLSLGAGGIDICPTPLPWIIFVVNKSGKWLVKKQKHLLYQQKDSQ